MKYFRRIKSGIDPKPFLDEIAAIDGAWDSATGRQDKIEVMDLNVKVHQLDGGLQQVQIKIDGNETELDTRQERLEEIRSKSFLRRLLRQ